MHVVYMLKPLAFTECMMKYGDAKFHTAVRRLKDGLSFSHMVDGH
jgi:hypothetical protein